MCKANILLSCKIIHPRGKKNLFNSSGHISKKKKVGWIIDHWINKINQYDPSHTYKYFWPINNGILHSFFFNLAKAKLCPQFSLNLRFSKKLDSSGIENDQKSKKKTYCYKSIQCSYLCSILLLRLYLLYILNTTSTKHFHLHSFISLCYIQVNHHWLYLYTLELKLIYINMSFIHNPSRKWKTSDQAFSNFP